MPLEVLSAAHRDALIDFLTVAFQLPRTAPFIDPRLLNWKNDDPRPDWEGSRSFAWMESGKITAHACVCPVTYRVADQQVKAAYLIDWAAGRSSPGAGVLLLRKLAASFQVLLAIGGSEQTVEILPKLGYQRGGELAFFARSIRPWRQSRTDPFPRGWKAPLRLGRNLVRSLQPRPGVPSDWSCTRIAAFEPKHAALLQAPMPWAATERTVELMNYWLGCPAAEYSAFLVSQSGTLRGWFVLSRVAGVVRIADLRIPSTDQADWDALCALAMRAGSSDPNGYELVAEASTPLAQEGLRRSGLGWHHSEPVFLLDPKKALLGQTPLDVTPLESDFAYLYDPAYPYLT